MTSEMLIYSRFEEDNAPYRSSCEAVLTVKEETDRLGSTWTMDHHSILQDKDITDPNEHDTVLCAYKWKQ